MNKARVLIVEHDLPISQGIQEALEEHGFILAGAVVSGAEAITQAALTRPDLILVDLQLTGEIDGRTTASKIQAAYDVPLIYLTDDVSEELLRSADISDPFQYLLKPFSGREIALNIEMAMYKHRMEKALQESEVRYMLALQGANDGFWDWNFPKNSISFSSRWKSMLGYADYEIGENPDEWLSRIHPQDLDQFRMELGAHIAGLRPHLEIEHRILHRDGNYRWVLTHGVVMRDRDGIVYRMAGSQTDISRRKQAEEQIRYEAFHDHLTGLPNRTLFLDRLELAVQRKRNRPDGFYAVFYLDIDDFKVIVDRLGHSYGDKLIGLIGQKLQNNILSSDTVARISDDNFALLCEKPGLENELDKEAQRFLDLFQEDFRFDGHTVILTARIGIAPGNAAYQDAEEVLRNAEIAMYQAKLLGRGRYAHYDPQFRERMVTRLEVENRLRRAIEKKEFNLVYQPIVSLQDGNILGFEALIRWQPPDRDTITPDHFIPLTEETGLIIPIGDWVLRQACSQNAKWQIRYTFSPPLKVSVNLSMHQLNQATLVGNLDRIIKEVKLNPACLRLELTESSLMGDPEKANLILQQINNLGIEVYLDDFGTGYSSLSYIQQIPVQHIKIDRSFIQRITHSEQNLEIVRTILKLATDLGMSTTAEGVETEEQVAILKELGCTYAQGSYFSIPLEIASVDHYLSEHYANRSEVTPIGS